MTRYVYLIRDGLNGPVKIGSSHDPIARLAALQTSNYRRLKLLLVFPEDGTIERLLHERFAAERVSGEWFQLRPDQLRALSDIVEEALFRDLSRNGNVDIRRRVAERILESERAA